MPVTPNPFESRLRTKGEALARLPRTLGESALVLTGIVVGTAQHLGHKGQELVAKGVEKYFENEYSDRDDT